MAEEGKLATFESSTESDAAISDKNFNPESHEVRLLQASPAESSDSIKETLDGNTVSHGSTEGAAAAGPRLEIASGDASVKHADGCSPDVETMEIIVTQGALACGAEKLWEANDARIGACNGEDEASESQASPRADSLSEDQQDLNKPVNTSDASFQQGCDPSSNAMHIGSLSESACSALLSQFSGANLARDPSLERIMTECSTAAQQMKKTISQVLHSRGSDSSSEGKDLDEQSMQLEVNIAEKLAALEQVIKQNVSSSTISEAFTSSAGVDYLESAAGASRRLSTPERVLTPGSKSSEDRVATSILTSDMSKKSMSAATPIKKEDKQESQASPKKIDKTAKVTTNKRKIEKSIDHVFKSLSGYQTAEEKLRALCQMHVELMEAARSTETALQRSERQASQLIREKEHLQTEHNRALLARSTLEGLCRELQRQNRNIKQETLLRLREEEEKRKDIAGKFQGTLNDVTVLVQDNHQRNMLLKEENNELTKKLQRLLEHYDVWEKQVQNVLKQRELEAQLAKAEAAEANIQLAQDREKHLKEKQELLEAIADSQKHITQLATTKSQLRAELDLYTGKYEDFQKALNHSNKVFNTFKNDMEQMTKKIKKLEKETLQWKTKWEANNKALLEMAEQKQNADKEIIMHQQKIITLEKLCRALQIERNELHKKVMGEVTEPATYTK